MKGFGGFGGRLGYFHSTSPFDYSIIIVYNLIKKDRINVVGIIIPLLLFWTRDLLDFIFSVSLIVLVLDFFLLLII